MSKSIDEIIREAMERGEFANLRNKGKRLDLTEYFDTPEEVRLGYSILKNADFVPEEVQLLKEIADLKEKLQKTTDETEQKRLRGQMEDRRLKYNLLVERFHCPRG
jgi:hypothetical protein